MIGCKKDTSPIIISFSGITETDEFNLVLRDDPDDWQPRCVSGIPNNFCILPAYPNPTDTLITFLFYVRDTVEVSIRIDDKPNKTIAFIEPVNVPPGLNKVRWITKDSNGNYLTNGIYRAYLNLNLNGIRYESYGDIQIGFQY